jgi:hypothetical protein
MAGSGKPCCADHGFRQRPGGRAIEKDTPGENVTQHLSSFLHPVARRYTVNVVTSHIPRVRLVIRREGRSRRHRPVVKPPLKTALEMQLDSARGGRKLINIK